MKKLNLKKCVVLLLVANLMLMTVACGANAESNMTEENNFNGEVSKEKETNKEMEKQTKEEEEDQEEIQEEAKGGSNVDTLNDITYSIISARVLDDAEYTSDDEGYQAILVDLLVENHSDSIIDISTVMYFEIVGGSGEDYGVEVFKGRTKGSLDSHVAPNKVLRGEFIFEAMDTEENFVLNISQDFMSDEVAVLGFEKNSTYDVEISESSKEGKTIGDEMKMETLTFVITGTSIMQEGDRTILKVDMTAKNNTGEEVTEFTIPFVLINTDGYVNDLDIKTDNYVLSEIPANGEKETSIYFKLLEPDMRSFDLYLTPFGTGAVDALHLEVE